jgi:hypothetical protein
MPDLFDRLFADAPPNAQPFMASEIGWGWGVPGEDGSPPAIHYVEFTPEIQEEFGIEIRFPNTPTESAGKPLTDRSARAVLLLCLNNVGDVLDLADLQDFTTVEA